MQYEVCGPFPIVDAITGESVQPGGLVELVDIHEGGDCNVRVNLEAGLIRVHDTKPAKAKPAKDGE